MSRKSLFLSFGRKFFFFSLSFFLFVNLAAFAQYVFVGFNKGQVAGGLQVIDGTSCINTSGTTCAASHHINLHTSDQLWMIVWWSDTTSCTSTIALSDTPTNTFAQIGSNLQNAWNGTPCIAQWQVQTAIANASDAVNMTITGTSVSNVGFDLIQIRGTANAAADQTATCDANSAGNGCPGPPNTGPSGTSSNVTTTHSAAIVVAGTTIGGGTTITPTTNGCFGVTGTVPANTGSSLSAVQYTILSSTGTGTCEWNYGSATTKIIELATFH